MANHNYYVYILTNPSKTVLYVGVTNDLKNRLNQHFEQRGLKDTFAGRYFCYHLIFWERYVYIDHAIAREKEIKGWRREKKISLIEEFNPEWKFLNGEV